MNFPERNQRNCGKMPYLKMFKKVENKSWIKQTNKQTYKQKHNCCVTLICMCVWQLVCVIIKYTIF